jgi:hypothetical protein
VFVVVAHFPENTHRTPARQKIGRLFVVLIEVDRCLLAFSFPCAPLCWITMNENSQGEMDRFTISQAGRNITINIRMTSNSSYVIDEIR